MFSLFSLYLFVRLGPRFDYLIFVYLCNFSALGLHFYHEEWGSIFFWNVDKDPPDYTTSYSPNCNIHDSITPVRDAPPNNFITGRYLGYVGLALLTLNRIAVVVKICARFRKEDWENKVRWINEYCVQQNLPGTESQGTWIFFRFRRAFFS